MNNLLLKIKKRYIAGPALVMSFLSCAMSPDEQVIFLKDRIISGLKRVDELQKQFNAFIDPNVSGSFEDHLLQLENHLVWLKTELIDSLTLAVNQNPALSSVALIKEAKEIFEVLHKNFGKLLHKLRTCNRTMFGIALGMNGELPLFKAEISKVIFKIKNYITKLKEYPATESITDQLTTLVEQLLVLVKSEMTTASKDKLKAALVTRLKK